MSNPIHWMKERDSKKNKRLLCEKCMKGSFLISHTPMARQVKTKTAHHMRIVARCEKCGNEKRIGFKG